MFERFTLDHVEVGQVRLRARYGGDGPAVVLLHGHPRTHTTWHGVAPRLADAHFVVCPDLRGYGQSTLPRDAPGHAQSSKRAMAADVVALMRRLGHERFSVVGHDRGALVAFRAAMDHPDCVERLVIMDGLPVVEHLERLNEDFVRSWWHWWFLGQTDKPAERVISADPEAWYRTPSPADMGDDNHADLWPPCAIPPSCTACARTIAPGLRVDRAHEEADRATGRKVACPTLLLAATEDDIDIHGDPETIWRSWVAGELRSRPIHSGHHQAEQAPDAVAGALLEFLSGR